MTEMNESMRSIHGQFLSQFLTLAMVLLIGTAGSPLWALQRDIKVKSSNYSEAPVIIRHVRVRLKEVFSTPTQLAIPGGNVKPSRIRYANRAGQLPSLYMLEGEIHYKNRSPQSVEALGLTIIPFDAFHQPIPVSGKPIVRQIIEVIPPNAQRQFDWSEQIRSLNVFEITVVITQVRFANGSVWHAPDEELIDVF